MIKLRIVEKDGYANYVLIDNNNNKHEVNINFMGVEKPNVGAEIYIDESVLKENVSLNFGNPGLERVADEKELIQVIENGEKMTISKHTEYEATR